MHPSQHPGAYATVLPRCEEVCLKLNLGLLSERAEQSGAPVTSPTLFPLSDRMVKIGSPKSRLVSSHCYKMTLLRLLKWLPLARLPAFMARVLIIFLYWKKMKWPDWSGLDLSLQEVTAFYFWHSGFRMSHWSFNWKILLQSHCHLFTNIVFEFLR